MVCYRVGIDVKKRLTSLKKEIFRKSIHICTAFVPVLLHFHKYPVIALLITALFIYLVSEVLRFKGINIPVVSEVTVAAARKRDENKIVLGPVTLVLGIVLSSLMWNEQAATVGILALGLGDGLASLAGKSFGRVEVPLTGGKTAAGSLTCFTAIFVSSWVITGNTLSAFLIAFIGTVIEGLPLKDYDNLLIPVILGGLASHLMTVV